MLIDTHLHLNFDAYDADRDAVIARAKAAGVAQFINPAVDIESSEAGIALAAAYPQTVYAAVGVHPNSTTGFTTDHLATIRALSQAAGVVSIGEIGLDYYWDKAPKADQWRALEMQLGLAADLGLPVIIHNREASADILPILESWAAGLTGHLRDHAGVLHSVSAPPELAQRALAAGFYLGFTGPITYKNADQTRHIAAETPLDRILVETDGPFLTPHPHRGKRNEPAYIPLIADRIAGIKQHSAADIAAITTENARRLFRLPNTA